MKNKKSLFWGLAGLAIVILVGFYMYVQEQDRRIAEAVPEGQMSVATQPTDATETSDASQQTPLASEQESAEAGVPGERDSTDTSQPTVGGETASETTAAPAIGEKADGSKETAALDVETATQPQAGRVEAERPVTADAESGQTAPQFDLLRVEPDGSTVIAGKAQPGTTVEVVAGESVLTEAPVGRTGDFAAVLDEPLAPGDYQITLREIREGEVVSQSEETATVSVPQDDPASLLVMVTRPGEASRLLTQPEATAETARSDRVPTLDTTQDQAAEQRSAPSLADQTAAGVQTPGAAGARSEKPELSQSTTSAPAASSASETSMVRDEPAASGTVSDTQTAALDRQSAGSAAGASDQLSGARLRIDAVEIEGGTVFVAGSAAPAGANVRVYANGSPMGDGRVSRSGRFLVEAEIDLPVGQHTISADLMMPGSDAATMRVAVPFTRPSGNAVAAVAAPQPAADANRPSETDSTAGSAPSTANDAAAGARTGGEVASQTQDTGSESSMETAAGSNDADSAGSTGTNDRTAAAGQVGSATVASADNAGPQTIIQPALQTLDGSVIIRRGDTLWQISRRVYGRGVRYTTIYLANTDQIANPDFIEPGQVFKVPETPLDNAEDLHRQRIRGR